MPYHSRAPDERRDSMCESRRTEGSRKTHEHIVSFLLTPAAECECALAIAKVRMLVRNREMRMRVGNREMRMRVDISVPKVGARAACWTCMLELGGRHSTSPGASHIRPHPTGVCRIDEQVGAAKLTLDMVGES